MSGPRTGSVALVGRPNAGKSTLMNRVLGEKLSIVSAKPQTTRRRLLGILTDPRGQMLLYDTPGIHRPLHHMNRQMVDEAVEALRDCDVVCLLIDVSEPPGKGEAYLLDLAKRAEGTRVLVLNKIDLVKKQRLLPRIAALAEGGLFADIVPVSAKSGDGVDRLLEVLWRALPEGQPIYDPQLLTVHPERFLAAERIREKLLEATEDELPFTTAVLIERWEEDEERDRTTIHASILVERSSQKGIVIGKGGAKIKEIGTAARLDLEEFLGRKVYLDLNVRHEPDWRENPRILAELERDAEAVAPGGFEVEGDELEPDLSDDE